MHNGQGTRSDPSILRVEDVITVGIPDDEYVDRDYLRLVLQDPQTYLPTRRNRLGSHHADFWGEPENSLVRRAKVLGLVASSAMLVCAVIVCAVLAQRPGARSFAVDHPDPFTGITALGALVAQGNTPRGTAADHASGHTSETEGHPSTPDHDPVVAAPRTTKRDASVPPDSATVTTEPSGATSSGTPEGGSDPTAGRTARPPATPGSASTPAEDRSEKLAVVREFYRRVAHEPDSATALLDLGLLGDQLNTLLTTWRSLEDVRLLQLHERSDGSVLAVVTMREADGRRVRITQVIEFAKGALINHVQLLSAQYI